MRSFRTALLVGIVILGGASLAVMARAGSPQVHVMNIQLPDGSIEQIGYTGDLMPQVAPAPDAAQTSADPFAAFAQLSAEMNRQMMDMMQMANAMAAPFPSAGQGPSFVSNGAGDCEQSIQIVAFGNAPPHVISQTSGDCGSTATPRATVPATLPAAPRRQPDLIRVKYDGAPDHAVGHKIWDKT
jgi:hypothetical protein